MHSDFRKFALSQPGVSVSVFDSYASAVAADRAAAAINPTADYLNPYILEERQLNVTQMDVFSRLMMDRIIFMGTQVSDQSAK